MLTARAGESNFICVDKAVCGENFFLDGRKFSRYQIRSGWDQGPQDPPVLPPLRMPPSLVGAFDQMMRVDGPADVLARRFWGIVGRIVIPGVRPEAKKVRR